MEAPQRSADQRCALDFKSQRRLPVGAELFLEGGVHFRVWASQCWRVEVVLEGGPGHAPAAVPVEVALEAEAGGYFSGLVPAASAGTLYRYRLDSAAAL